MKKLIKAAIIIVPVLLVCIFIKPVNDSIQQVFFLFGMCDVDSVKGYILSFGIWAPIVSFLLMVFQSVIAPLPAFLITFSNAALFGWLKGALLSWSSAMAGAALCFYISRFFGRDVVIKFTSRAALENIDQFFEKYGKYTILISRLLPFISFDVVSYAAGLTSMSFWSFFWATGLGQLPATLIYSYSGEMLIGGTKNFVFGLLILFALSTLAIMIRKMFYHNEINNSNI